MRAGGAPRSIAAIVAQESARSRIEIITKNADLGVNRPFGRAETDPVDRAHPQAVIRRCSSRQAWIALWRRLRDRKADVDIVYLNSLFSPGYSLWPILLMSARLVQRHPILLAPRGELTDGALSIKGRRKRVAGELLRPLLGRLDITWHASTAQEAGCIRRFLRGRDQPIFVRNDPAIPPAAPSAPENDALAIAFVARMVPIKNFEFLIGAARYLTVPGRIVVAGVLEDQDYWNRCRKLIDELPAHVSVEILGHIDSAAVTDLLCRSDAMVLPTMGENFGHAIAEAMSVGCPVLVPDTTPWTAVVAEGCGWVIDLHDPSTLSRALQELAARPQSARHAARRQVASRYAQWWSDSQVHQRSLFAAAFEPQPAGSTT